MQQLTVKNAQSEPLLSLSFLRKRIPVEFQGQFVEDTKTCLDCGEKIVEKDDEIVCSRCGRVWNDLIKVETESIPFDSESVESGHAESHWNPACALSFGNGMGGYMALRSLYRVLATAAPGAKDLPLRVNNTRVMVNRLDHPYTQTMLSYGSELCKDFGFHDRTDFGVKFADQLGHELRKVAAFYAYRGESMAELRVVAKGVFFELYTACFPARAPEVMKKLGLTQDDVNWVGFLLNGLKKPKQSKAQKKY